MRRRSPGTGYDGVVYSANFSYSSVDRSWRWRALPAKARNFPDDAAEAAETINPTSPVDVCYPQTIELREDMTINIRGVADVPTDGRVVGRWTQRYLPAGNLHVPPAASLVGGMPAVGYNHPLAVLPGAGVRGRRSVQSHRRVRRRRLANAAVRRRTGLDRRRRGADARLGRPRPLGGQ